VACPLQGLVRRPLITTGSISGVHLTLRPTMIVAPWRVLRRHPLCRSVGAERCQS
jgi:hypothetical protein